MFPIDAVDMIFAMKLIETVAITGRYWRWCTRFISQHLEDTWIDIVSVTVLGYV